MACAGCGKTFRDKWVQTHTGPIPNDCVPRSTYYDICYGCMAKALELEPASPEELVKLYRHMIANGLYIAQSLLDEQLSELAANYLDPTDRMFNPRSA